MKDLHLLGLKCRDRVTESEGIVTSVSYDLFGCIQAVLSPATDKDGKRPEAFWYDTKRLEVLDQTPVMTVPDFSKEAVSEPPGGESHPLPSQY